MRFQGVKMAVLFLMRHDKQTRNSDHYLYAELCRKINPAVETMSFVDVMKKKDSLGLPGFESVRRARQKIQEDHKELSADADVSAARELREEEYRTVLGGL